jgi:ABC-type dipeptide/oligopeptide/nickel transport system permease subunit/ABC-type transport system substrate-binding protein
VDPRALARFRANGGAMIGAVLVLVVVVAALLGPFVAPYDPDHQFADGVRADGTPLGFSAAHWLGTDALGRDELSRLLYGGRISLAVALSATVLAVALGLLIGVLAGHRRGAFEAVSMQTADVFQSVPFLLLAIAINRVIDRPELWSLTLLLGGLSWVPLARVTRTKTMQVRELDYVHAARALGMSESRIVLLHVLPNVLGPAIVLGTSLVAQMILAESAMSFLGVGVQPPTSTWASMLRDGEELMSLAPRLVIAPGIVIAVTTFGFNLVGEGLRDALDPKDAAGPRAERSDRTVAVVGLGLVAALAVVLFFFLPPVPTSPIWRGAGATEPHHGGTFVFFHESDVHGFDPHVSYDQLSGMGQKLLFEGLVDYDHDVHFVPRLAREMPTVSEDGLVYTFRLREGVRFHNGRELEAEDVRWSMEHMLAPSTHSPGLAFYSLIDGYDDYENGAPHLRGIEVLDRYTVRFRLSAPDQTFLNAMAMIFAYPVPHEMYEQEDPARHPIGTGAFVLESWEPGVRVTFRRNPAFFRAGEPYVDRMVYELNLQRGAAFMRFLRGDLDHIHRATPADRYWIRHQPGWSDYAINRPLMTIWGVGMNCEIAPFTDVHVRRAVAAAIDRDRWQRARGGNLLLNGQPLPPGVPGYDPDRPDQHRFDLARARHEMALAGHPVHPIGDRWVAEGLETPIEFWVGEGDTGRQWGELAQQDLAQIGLTLSIRQVAFPIFLQETGHRRTVPMLLAGWSADYPDASNFLDVLFSSSSIHDTTSENRAFYHSDRVDALLARARVERDPDVRVGMYHDAVGMILEDAPWGFVFTDTAIEAWQPYVHGYAPHPVWDMMYRDVWLDLPRRQSMLQTRARSAFAAATPFGGWP